MRERRDYVVPFFNNKYRFDKPPLIYWMQIASYRFLGENDFAARLPSVIAAAGIAILLFAWGRRLGNEQIGWWAAIIFTLCLQTFVHAKAAVADMWLVFFVTAAYWAAYELIADLLGSTTTINESHRKYWRLTFYVALGLAFLAKGPLGWMPLVTVVSMKLILRGKPFNRRFWFLSGLLLTIAIVLSWGFPALLRTDGEFLRIGIGRHVVERSFGALEGHGGQSWHSYLLTLPFYFVTVFISFFPWSIKLPALTKHLRRHRDGTDKYLILGVASIFILMTLVKTKLPHYTLAAFPLLALLLARHFPILPGSPRFAVRTAVVAAIVSITTAFVGFSLLAPSFPVVQLFKKSEKDLRPEMHFGNVDYAEPSLVWYFRGRVHGFSWDRKPEQVKEFMGQWGPKFIILPTKLAKSVYPEIPAGWKSYTAEGINFAKGKRADLTMILKPTE